MIPQITQAVVEWCNANQGFLSACLTFVYVGATIWLVLLAKRQLTFATILESSRTRPFVIFDLLLDHHCVFAQIINSGQTAARDVRITVKPDLHCVMGGEGSYPAAERSVAIPFIERGVEMLAPGREITACVGFWRRVHDAYPGLRFEGAVSYADTNGNRFSEPFVADLAAREGLLYRGTKDIEDVARQLEAIARTFDHLATGFSKPLVRTMTEQEYIAQEEAFIEEALKTESAPPPPELQPSL